MRTLSGFHRAVLIFSAPLFLLAAWAVPAELWAKGAAFLAQGDVARFWLNRAAAVGTAAGCLALEVLILHLLLKRVTVSAEGAVFTGLFRRSVLWSEVREAQIEVERHTSSLHLRSITGEKYEIGIGDAKAAEICRGIVAAIANPAGAPTVVSEPDSHQLSHAGRSRVGPLRSSGVRNP